MNKEKLQKEIQDMKAKLACMEEQLEKCNEWEMEPAKCYISSDGKISVLHSTTSINMAQKFGMKRHTKELAEIACKRMKEANLLEYWASVIDPDWRDEGIGRVAWYVYYSDGKYNIDRWKYHRGIGSVYMSRKSAIKICNALNKGELKLG